jgi:hypothetical protein
MPKTKRTPAQVKAWRKELSDRCDAFLARNDAESLSYAKIDGGYYSDRNAALIAVTAEDAGLDPSEVTAVGSYGRWQAVGRQVREGSDALRVWAPAGESKPDPDDPDGKRRKFFKPVPMFAYEQTYEIGSEEDLAHQARRAAAAAARIEAAEEVVPSVPASIAAYS